jgi:hypothetical protein
MIRSLKNTALKLWLGLFFVGQLSCAIADTAAATTQTTPSPAAQKPRNLFFCPPASSLKKDPVAMTWATPDHQWKSYGTSFETSLTQFWGAQWSGVVVGQLTCIYHAEEKTTFPVMLIYHALTLEPHTGKWSSNLGGFKNCVARDPNDCPFQVRLRPSEKNFFDQVDDLKNTPNSGSTPGS